MITFKTFYSELDKWVELSGNWYTATVMDGLENFLAGFQAAVLANVEIGHAPSDIGSLINLELSKTHIDDIFRKYWILKFFCDSIHYEADELIDAPFTLSLEDVIKQAYDLNPKNFRTKSNLFGFIERGETLESIVSSTFSDISLKKAFQEKAKQLNEDKPSQNFKDAIAEAKFWKKEYVKAEKIRKITQKYMDKYGFDWDGMNSNDKLEILNKYCVEIGKIMDEKKFYEFTRGNKVGVEVKWISDSEDPTSTSYGFTYPSRRDGMVYISDSFKYPSTDIYGIEHAFNTVAHEVRHQYQAFSINDTKRYNTPSYLVTDWSDRKTNYWERPIEVDARAFSALVMQ